jgi:mannose-1-phosphate guanylyltransferase
VADVDVLAMLLTYFGV